MNARLLIKGGTVLSLDRSVGNVIGADVLIDDGVIIEVGTSLRARNAEVIEAADCIVMPGFVDAHRHLSRTLTRNLELTTDAATHFTPDDVYAATLVGLLQGLEAGTTTVVDWCEVAADPACREAALSAHADAGARVVFVPHISGAAPDVATAELERIAETWARTRADGQRIHARAGMTLAAGGELAQLAARGLLGPDVTLTIGAALIDADFDAIAASSTEVVLTPARDMAAGSGPPPVQQLIDRNIRPGLGVGDEALAPGDVFAQMRSVISVQHATSFDLRLAGKGGVPNLLTTRDVIRYATVDGARAAGLGHRTGSLSPGMQADVLVLRADRANIAPVNDAIGAVVWGMDTSNVDWVLVGGRPLVERGQLTADVARARQLATAAQQRLIAAGAASA